MTPLGKRRAFMLPLAESLSALASMISTKLLGVATVLGWEAPVAWQGPREYLTYHLMLGQRIGTNTMDAQVRVQAKYPLKF
jgi:hypothetical protein